MIDLNRIKISRFNLNSSTPLDQVSIFEELKDIQTGKYSETVNKARKHLAEGNLDMYAIVKKTLPAVTFSGSFMEKRRLDFLQTYTGFLVIDIDKLNLNDIISIKDVLAKDEFVLSVWISPSGMGLKLLIQLESTIDTHKILFDSLISYFHEKYNIKADITGSDITRLCFSSYDSNLILKATSTKYSLNQIHFKISNPIIKNSIAVARKETIKADPVSIKKAYYDTKDRNKSSDRDLIDKILKYLRNRKKTITPNYESWYRVALAISNTFTLELGTKYFLAFCRLDGEKHNEEKSISILEYCYRNRIIGRVTINTIIYFAKQNGMEFKSLKTN